VLDAHSIRETNHDVALLLIIIPVTLTPQQLCNAQSGSLGPYRNRKSKPYRVASGSLSQLINAKFLLVGPIAAEVCLMKRPYHLVQVARARRSVKGVALAQGCKSPFENGFRLSGQSQVAAMELTSLEP